MKPTNIDNQQVNSLKTSQDISLSISNNELIKIIEDNLETKYRETYLRLKGGAKISKQDLVKLQDHIQHILHKNNLNDEI